MMLTRLTKLALEKLENPNNGILDHRISYKKRSDKENFSNIQIRT